MKTFILRFETYGIKNIENKISIDFAKATVSKKINIKNNCVTAIYGLNGSGKTALMYSIYLYKKIVEVKNFLIKEETINEFYNITNKKINQCYFNMIFAVCNDDLTVKNVISHSITLELKNREVLIKKETMRNLISQTINGEYSDIYVIEDGNIVFDLNENKELTNLLIDKSKNLLTTRPIASIINDSQIIDIFDEKYKNKIDVKENIYGWLAYSILQLQFSLANIRISFDEGERIIQPLYENVISNTLRVEAEPHVVNKNKFTEYKEQVKRLVDFIKLFKPNLKNILIESDINKDFYNCRLIFDYGDYKISSVYESTGIKRIITLFSYFQDLMNGKIIFIDELDAIINGIYLTKLIEHFMKFAEGQLCYSTHCTDSMDLIAKNNGTLYFLGETGKLISWIKNGNYSAYKRYKEGMIEDSPFNLSIVDMLKVFPQNNE